jgi:hypothetical protein
LVKRANRTIVLCKVRPANVVGKIQSRDSPPDSKRELPHTKRLAAFKKLREMSGGGRASRDISVSVEAYFRIGLRRGAKNSVGYGLCEAKRAAGSSTRRRFPDFYAIRGNARVKQNTQNDSRCGYGVTKAAKSPFPRWLRGFRPPLRRSDGSNRGNAEGQTHSIPSRTFCFWQLTCIARPPKGHEIPPR